jgi:hypothetical protein
MPFDDRYYGRKTQLKAINEAISDYGAEGHEGFAMTPLNAKAIVYIGLVRRIKGEPMPIEEGIMLDGTLRRMNVAGYSAIGGVRSYFGQLRLCAFSGNRDPDVGVGLSVGPTVQVVELEESK